MEKSKDEREEEEDGSIASKMWTNNLSGPGPRQMPTNYEHGGRR